MNAKEVIEMAGYKTQSYSGRGMYGKQCLGVQVDDSVFQFYANVIEQAADEIVSRLDDEHDDAVYDVLEEVGKMLRRTRSDSLGLSTIIYWPSIPWEEDNGADSAA